MNDDDIDPYELHAERYLFRLQDIVRRFRETTEEMDSLLTQLNRLWFQVLAAWAWSCSRRDHPVATRLSEKLNACTHGHSIHTLQRTPEEVERWSHAVSDFANSNPIIGANGAAFLYKTAGVALTEGGLLKLSRDHNLPIDDVLKVAARLLKRSMPREGRSTEEARHGS